jgi:hypothetical protein
MLLILLLILILLAAFGGFWGGPRYGRIGWSPFAVTLILLLIIWVLSGATLP